jgi:serine/threonine protein kinase/tetratricopeptide (TPR) repeat protein
MNFAMPESRKCSRCGAALPADALGGHCLPCLLQLGLQSDETPAEQVAAGILPAHEGGVLPPGASLAEKPGDRIGRYKLLQQIGEGGCGVVYMAEQEEPVRRRVALKIIKLGMDTRKVIARFEAERQALAMMDHPNIAKVFDAGATECPLAPGSAGVSPASSVSFTNEQPVDAGAPRQVYGQRQREGDAQSAPRGRSQIAIQESEIAAGRPYFVMELVRGVKITTYCDQQKLSTRQRLDLFIQVCQAIQHAHQKGIIHRDLKPSNILVTEQDGAPVPKIIDFGIAKATTDQRLTDKTLFTAFEQFIGTPAYMSPEQAGLGGLDIDTRSDIYSLGVLLYELLTGKTPFDANELLKAGLDEMCRTIREKEPDRPSTRVSTVSGEELTTTAKRRGIVAPKLVNVLRGDLDWIVMKCLEKDRARRYETANGLASDIRRHLNNEPVVACPPSRLYRFQKTVRRNKLAFAAGAGVAAALLIGLGVSTWMFLQERKAQREQARLRQLAEVKETKAQQVAQFLEDMLKGVGSSVALGRDTMLLKEILNRTAEHIGKDLTNQPEVEAELRNTIGNIYLDLGEYEKAQAMHREALAIRRRLFGNEHPDVAASLKNLASAIHLRSRWDEAEQMFREALAIRRKLLGNEHPDVAESLDALADLRAQLGQPEGKLDEAETLFREAVAIWRVQHGNRDVDLAKSLVGLANVLRWQRWQGRLVDAEPLCREALAIQRKLLGNEHPAVADSLNLLGLILGNQRKSAEGETVFREALAMVRKLRGEKHSEVGSVLSNLGEVLRDQGGQSKLAESESMFREALEIARRDYGLEYSPAICANLLDVLYRQSKYDEAEKFLNESLTPSLQKSAPARAAWFRDAKTELLARRGRWREAIADLQSAKTDVLKWYREAAASGDAQVLINLAWFLATCDDAQFRDGRNAVTFAEQAVLKTERKEPGYLNTLAAAYAEVGEFDKAVSTQNEAIALLRDEEKKRDFATWLRLYESKIPYRESPLARLLNKQTEVLRSQGKLAEAETGYREALETAKELLGDKLPDVAELLRVLGNVLHDSGQYEKAETVLRQAVEIRQELYPDGGPELAVALNDLATVLDSEHKLAEAEELLRKSLAMKRDPVERAWSLANLGHVLLNQEKPAEAEIAYRDALATATEHLGHQHRGVANMRFMLAGVLMRQDKLAEAETLAREGLATLRKSLGHEHPQLATSLVVLGSVLSKQGQLDQAEAVIREGLEMYRKFLGNEHPEVANALDCLAGVLQSAGKFQQAEPVVREALAIKEKLFGSDHPQVTVLLAALAKTLMEQGKLVEAEELFRKALTVRRTSLGNDDMNVANLLSCLAGVLIKQGKFSEAKPLAYESLTLSKKLLGDDHPAVATILSSIAVDFAYQGQLLEAEKLLREALEIRRKRLGNENPHTGSALNNLGGVLFRQGKLAEAEPFLREAVDLYRKNPDWPVKEQRTAFNFLGKALAEQGNLVEAELVQSEVLAILRRGAPDDPSIAASLAELAVTLIAEHKFTGAEPTARECLEFRQKHYPNDWTAFSARVLLGESLLGQKKYTDAEPLLLSGYEGMAERKEKVVSDAWRYARQPRLKKALELLVRFYEETGRPDRAAEWKQKLAEFEKDQR